MRFLEPVTQGNLQDLAATIPVLEKVTGNDQRLLGSLTLQFLFPDLLSVLLNRLFEPSADVEDLAVEAVHNLEVPFVAEIVSKRLYGFVDLSAERISHLHHVCRE